MEQTNRTILFEEINPNRMDLLTLISGDGKLKSLNDEDIYRIHQHLKVSSYDEFIDKFKPSVNMYLDTETCTVSFDQNENNLYGQRLYLDEDNSLLNTLIRLIETKKNKKYLLKSFDDMLVHFFPIADIQDFLNERNEMLTGLEADGAGLDNLEDKVERLLTKYQDGIFLLNVYLYEVSNMVVESSDEVKSDKGILNNKDHLQIKVLKKASKYKCRGYRIDNKKLDEYRVLLNRCISKVVQQCTYKHGALFEACIMLPIEYTAQEMDVIQKKYERYLNLYSNIIREFWRTSKPLMETCLGVREFFAPYANTNGMHPTLLVSNLNISDLKEPQNKELLELYLSTVNTKNDFENTIWYAIVPNVAYERKNRESVVRERFLARGEKTNYVQNEIEDVMVLLEILANYRIQSFLSMTLSKEYTFANIAEKGAEVLRECHYVFDEINEKDYVIPCFPNFTVISKEDAYQIVSKKIDYDDLSERIEVKEDNIVWLDTIGIGAAYVAAGLFAACQCPEYLGRYFGNRVNKECPGVSYRFSEGNNYLVTTSGMLSESICFDEVLENELIEWSRGILFGNKKGKMAVLTERVLSYNRDNKVLVPMIQTINYIERKIQYETQDFKKNLIHYFFQKRPGSIISQWYSQDSRVVNNLLRNGEELEYEMDEKSETCTFHIKFNNNELVRSDTVSIFKEQ